MMRTFTTLIVVLATFGLGCDNVTVDAPFGETVSSSTLKSFRGTWVDKQGNVCFVELGGASELIVGFTEWNAQKNLFETKSVPMSVRTANDRTFLFIPQDTDKEGKLIFIWLSEIKDDLLSARTCNADAFRKAVLAGELDGVITNRKNNRFDVHLSGSEKLEKLLLSADGEQLFDSKPGDPLRRLTASPDAR